MINLKQILHLGKKLCDNSREEAWVASVTSHQTPTDKLKSTDFIENPRG
jgi:hypothetical protein